MSFPTASGIPSDPVSNPSTLSLCLARSGTTLLVALPLAMWLANRSAPLFLGLAALCFAASAVAEEGGAVLFRRLRGGLRSPAGTGLSAFLLWSLLSIAWSHRPVQSIAVWGEFALPMAFTLVIAASRKFRPTPMLLRALALAIILTSALVMIELASGLSQRAALGSGKMMAFIFNRPVIVAVVLAVPVVHHLWTMPSGRGFDRSLAVLTASIVVILALFSQSASAKLGVVVAALCWVLAALMPRAALGAIGLAFVLTMAIGPVLGVTAERGLPTLILDRLPKMTGQARIDIWRSFGEVAWARPIAGTGFGTSASMHEHPVAADVSPEQRLLLAVGHPHDMPLQAWAETGLIGATLLTLTGLLLLVHLRHLPARELAPRLALFATVFSIATVGHGAWQGWWIAGLGAAILWFENSDETRLENNHG